MLRLVLHLILALTLVLNGISAPWAMGRMSHDEQGASGSHAVHADQHTKRSTEATAHHGHHDPSEPATGAPVTRDHADHGDSGACCDGAACHCGCMLPLVIELRVAGIQTDPDNASRWAAASAHLVLYREAPPLRPPTA